MAQIFHLPRAVPVTSAGRPYPRAQANFYLTGSTTRANVFTTSALNVPHSNPVIADSSGVFPAIYLDSEVVYKLVLTQSDGTLIYEVDPVSDGASIGTPFYETTTAETTAGVTVVNPEYHPTNVLRYGTNTVPGTTNMTTAIQSAMNVVYAQGGGTVFIPAGTYLFTGNLRPPISADTSSRTFRLHGDGMESTKLVTNNASGILVYGDDPPDDDNVMVSFDIDGFSILNTGTAFTGIGIDFYHCQRWNLGNVRITNFNYGVRARSSWNFTIDKRTQLDANNVGFKVPQASASHVAFNTANISGVSFANNIKAGFSIANGNAISIEDILLESNPVGGYIVDGIAQCRFSTAYYEGSGPAPTEPNRNGTDVTHLLVVGRDEDGNAGDTASPNTDLQFGCLMDHAGEGVIYLDNVNGVTFLDHRYAGNFLTFGPNVRNVRAHTISGENTTSSPIVQGRSKSTARNVLRDISQNWIPNGNFMLPGLPYMSFTGSATASITTQSINSKDARVLDVLCPGGNTTLTVTIPIHGLAGAEYESAYTGEAPLINCTMHGIASSADFATATIQFTDESANTLTGGTVKSTGLTSLFVLSGVCNPNEIVAANNLLNLKITLTRTTGTGDAHFYIDELAVFPDSHAQLTTLSAFDSFVGLSGTLTATTTIGSSFYGEVDTGLGNVNFYRVIANRLGSSETLAPFQVYKMTDADSGKFRIITATTGISFDYLVIPTVMRMP